MGRWIDLTRSVRPETTRCERVKQSARETRAYLRCSLVSRGWKGSVVLPWLSASETRWGKESKPRSTRRVGTEFS